MMEFIPDRDNHGVHLVVDGTYMSHLHDDPTVLLYGYVHCIGNILLCTPRHPLKVLHLGGGAMTLPRWLDAMRPGSQSVVVEKDAEMVELVNEFAPVPESVQVVVGDAVEEVLEAPSDAYDAIIVDCMDSEWSVPGYLTSREGMHQMKEILHLTGVLVINLVINGEHDPLLTEVEKAMTSEFMFVTQMIDKRPRPGERRNVVMAGWSVGDAVNQYRLELWSNVQSGTWSFRKMGLRQWGSP